MLEAIVLASTLSILAMGIYNALTARRFERFASTAPNDAPFVSVLIPARDEEANLRRHLPRLLASRYARFEVRVLDDGSTDGTRAVLESFRAQFPDRLFLHEGSSLPKGWLGKNWACHQLATEARGDLFIFCDADVAIGEHAIARTASAFLDDRIAAFSALPRQNMESLAERAIVPFVMQISVLALLPLRFAERSANAALVAATGQWLAFRRWSYFAIGGHASVRSCAMEDMELGRRAKKVGRLATAIANEDLSIRMYRGGRELRDGFGKNAYLLAGGNPFLAVGYLGFHFLVYVAPLLGLGGVGALAALVAFRALGVLVFRGSGRAALAHLAGAILFPLLIVDSYFRHASGKLAWKGRLIPRTSA